MKKTREIEFDRAALDAGLEQMDITLPSASVDKLIAFLHMLVKWNRVYNLSAIREPADMLSLHLLDSLSVLPHLHGESCIDVGTGAGLPGIPLAIARPDMRFGLLDSNSKKTRFVQQACIELGLKNVSCIHDRIERYQPVQKFDTVTARAFTSLPELLTLTRHLLMDDGQLLAMKSKEVDVLERDDFKFNRVESLRVPTLEAERNLVIYSAT
ncbi:16S rRNA (guanine(527)-N(7))-methyltransferase RsmG [Cycloclasticus sp. 46_120_T64]|mgnify:FL=1|nr:16S rRNA (guanine(527)-N(7))-methyltransferase RsmG [Cycloclasticus sp. 46_120_T64]